MNVKFRIRRVLVLCGVVVFLAFVYLVVRNQFYTITGSRTNPADSIFRSEWEYQEKYWSPSQYLVIEDPKDPISIEARASVEFALECLGQQPVYVTRPGISDLEGNYAGIIITATELNKIDILYSLLDYAENGGLLIFAVRPEVDEMFRSVYQQVGIYEHSYFMETSAIHFAPGIYSDSEFSLESSGLYNSSIELRIREDCNVMAVSDSDIPLIWSLQHGQGNILFMNNSLMQYKSTGGLLLTLISRIEGPVLYPVVNSKVFALQGLPLPVNVNQDFIKTHYLRTGRTFLRDLWWPEMVRLQTANNITYTAGFMTGYDSEEPLAEDSILVEEMDFAYYGKELARYGGEIAFTGFNQVPLHFSELDETMKFTQWSSIDQAKIKNRDAIHFFQNLYPDYQLYSYIPPERILDEQGYTLIKEVLPKLEAVCGDFNDENLWLQNFEVKEDGIVSFPVVTTGFEINDMTRFNLINVAAARGVLFHSCDVSDLLLESDENRVWNQLAVDFGEFLGDYYGTSVFESMTVTQAAGRVKLMQSLDPEITYNDGRIDVRVSPGLGSASFMLQCFGKEPQNSPGVTCIKIHDFQYLITTDMDEFSVELKNL